MRDIIFFWVCFCLVGVIGGDDNWSGVGGSGGPRMIGDVGEIEELGECIGCMGDMGNDNFVGLSTSDSEEDEPNRDVGDSGEFWICIRVVDSDSFVGVVSTSDSEEEGPNKKSSWSVYISGKERSMVP